MVITETGRSSAQPGAPASGALAHAQPPFSAGHAWLVFFFALLLFSPGLVTFAARVTELSALRVVDGDVPYRDFWTMYSPGSIYVMALAFRVFGEKLLVANLLGILVSAAAVAVYYRVAVRVMPNVWALVSATVFAIAFFHAPYHAGLNASYPTAILCIWLAADRIARHAVDERARHAAIAGLWLGFAILCKHDLGGYASIAATVALLLVPAKNRLRDFAVMAATACAVVIPAVVALLAAGAGPEMWQDIIVWPLTDFRIVRPEYFPLLPSLWRGSLKATIMGNTWWANLQLPLLLVLVSVPLLWRARHRIATEQKRILAFALTMFPLVWLAAHVQVNTHRVTLPALGALVGFSALLGMRNVPTQVGARWRVLLLVVVTGWMLSLLPERIALYYQAWFPHPTLLHQPRVAGIVAAEHTAAQFTALANAIEQAGPPEAPLLMLAARNDIVIHAAGVPYWLSERRMVTRHHELHPDITDTEPRQRRMLEDIARGPAPVVVLEHRFGNKALDKWRGIFQQQGLHVGSTLLDDWVRANYTSGPRFGMYEVLLRKRSLAVE